MLVICLLIRRGAFAQHFHNTLVWSNTILTSCLGKLEIEDPMYQLSLPPTIGEWG